MTWKNRLAGSRWTVQLREKSDVPSKTWMDYSNNVQHYFWQGDQQQISNSSWWWWLIKFILACKHSLWRADYVLIISPIQHFLTLSLWNAFSNLLIPNSINQSKLNRPVFSTNSSVSFTSFGSPSRFSVLIFLLPTFFRSSFLGSSYFLQSRRKCFTVSTPRPHSHVGSSIILCRLR